MAGYKATRHLLDLGCKNIGIITTPEHVTVGLHREQGYEKALREVGKDIDRNMIIEVDEREDIYNQINELFTQKSRCCFCSK